MYSDFGIYYFEMILTRSQNRNAALVLSFKVKLLTWRRAVGATGEAKYLLVFIVTGWSCAREADGVRLEQ